MGDIIMTHIVTSRRYHGEVLVVVDRYRFLALNARFTICSHGKCRSIYFTILHKFNSGTIVA